jgi:hypothetical protein
VVTRRDMHEAEPLLYWRVRRNGVWKFERARYVIRNAGFNEYIVEPPEVNESD